MSIASPSRNASIQWAPEIHREHNDLSEEEESDHYEDWSKTTDDKDSFANQVLRRNIGGLKWKKVQQYPATNTIPAKDRAGSILSTFEVGHEDGIPIPENPAEREEYERRRRVSSSGATQLEKIENYPQLQKEYLENRQGSVLSAFVRENQHFDDAKVLPQEEIQERRNSNVGIEKIENYPTLSREEREKRISEGRHGSILGVFVDDHEEARNEPNAPKERRSSSKKDNRPVIENYPANSHKRTISGSSSLEVPNQSAGRRKSMSNGKDRRGSVLSLWTDDDADSQHEFATEDNNSDKLSSKSSSNGSRLEPTAGPQRKGRALSGSERRGSILSMWAPGKNKGGDDVMDHGDSSDDDHIS